MCCCTYRIWRNLSWWAWEGISNLKFTLHSCSQTYTDTFSPYLSFLCSWYSSIWSSEKCGFLIWTTLPYAEFTHEGTEPWLVLGQHLHCRNKLILKCIFLSVAMLLVEWLSQFKCSWWTSRDRLCLACCGISSVADVPHVTPISVNRSYFRHIKVRTDLKAIKVNVKSHDAFQCSSEEVKILICILNQISKTTAERFGRWVIQK